MVVGLGKWWKMAFSGGLKLDWNRDLFFEVGACWSGLCVMNVSQFLAAGKTVQHVLADVLHTASDGQWPLLLKPSQNSMDYFLADWFLLFLSLHPLRSCIPHEFPSNHLAYVASFYVAIPPPFRQFVKVPPLPTRPPAMHSSPAAGLPTRHPTLDESRVIPASRYPCSRPPATQKQGGISWYAYATWIEGMEWKNWMKHMILPCHHMSHIVQKETMYSKYGWVCLLDVAGTSSEVTWDREKHPEMNWQQCIFRSLSCFDFCELSNLDFWTCSRSPLRALCSRRQAPKANPKSSSFNDRRNKDTLRHQVLDSVCSYQQ